MFKFPGQFWGYVITMFYFINYEKKKLKCDIKSTWIPMKNIAVKMFGNVCV